MNIQFGVILSYVSVALAILFWLLSSQQAKEAKSTLKEIKDAMLTWQAELNKVSMDILSSRPEVIAKQTALEETKIRGEFSGEMAKIIKQLSENPSSIEEGGGYKISIIEKLLDHHKSLIVEKEKIMANAVSQNLTKDR
jgi:hypothetical protein